MRAALAILAALALLGCGVKGDPVPPSQVETEAQ
ncbi:MAG: lipoprotein [Rubrimonas sp.]